MGKRTTPRRDPATPQTKARLKKGTLEKLITSGRISSTGPEIQAAEDIYRVWSSSTHGLGLAQSAPERVSRSFGTMDPSWLISARQDRYLPFMRTASNAEKNIVVAVVIEGHSARALDRAYRKRSGTCLEILLHGLRRYAVLAGWAKVA